MTDDSGTAPTADLVGRAGGRTVFTGRVIDGPASGLNVELETGIRVRATGVDVNAWSPGEVVRVEARIPCTESALVPGADALVMADRVERVRP